MDRLIVADAGPIIHLTQADAVALLERVGRLRIPQTVLDELSRGSFDLSDLQYSVVSVDADLESTYSHLDPGETAALEWCVDCGGIFLTDDLAARETAKTDGIEVHGSIGVILHGYSDGELSATETKRLLRALQRDTNLYLSAPLVEHAIERVDTDNAGW